jgi:alpha-beta hydrolase superfamily lysophospholipase
MSRPLLLVHGMCCTGGIWDNFRTFYESRGFRVYTPTLRPEERRRSRPPRALHGLRFTDYIADLEQEVARIEGETGRRPVVIGHSMGGLLAQALAERNIVSAAVFISPTPPAGVHTPRFRRFWRVFAVVRALGLVPRALYPFRAVTDRLVFNRVPRDARGGEHAKMVHESREVFADFPRHAIDETKIKIPVLTVAATRDRLVTADVVRLTAQKYERVGGAFKEYENHGHWLYAEPGWEEPAREILEWIEAST